MYKKYTCQEADGLKKKAGEQLENLHTLNCITFSLNEKYLQRKTISTHI